MRIICSLLFFASTVLLRADPFTINAGASCITNLGQVNDPSSCSNQGVGPGINGSVTASASALANLQISSLTTSISASAFNQPTTDLLGNVSGITEAASGGEILLHASSLGLFRNGYVLLSPSNQVLVNGPGQTQYSVEYSISNAPGFHQPIGCDNSPACTLQTELVPIVLGTDFYFVESFAVDARDDNSVSLAELNLNLNIQFFEADGVTPVDIVTDAPEPRPLMLTAIGLLALVTASRRR